MSRLNAGLLNLLFLFYSQIKIITCSTIRSLVRLELGNYSAALQDANEALLLAPNYSEVL